MEEVLAEFMVVLESPEVALFAGIWVVAFLLKNYTALNNNYIPFIVVGTGILLAIALVSVTIQGAILGAAIGVFLVGGHSFVKHAGKMING